MDSVAVEGVYQDFHGLRESLANDPSGLVALERIFPKALLLAAASYLEHSTRMQIAALFEERGLPEFRAFVEKQVLARQYHTLFQWDKPKGANSLFALFGDECKKRFERRKESDEEFSDCVDAFLQIGQSRNLLVHNNYADFQMTKTADDIYKLFEKAKHFPMRIQEVVCVAVESVQAKPDDD